MCLHVSPSTPNKPKEASAATKFRRPSNLRPGERRSDGRSGACGEDSGDVASLPTNIRPGAAARNAQNGTFAAPKKHENPAKRRALAVSGRMVREPANTGDFAHLRSYLRASCHVHTGRRAHRDPLYAIPHTRMLIRGVRRRMLGKSDPS